MRRTFITLLLLLVFTTPVTASRPWEAAEKAVRASTAAVQYADGGKLAAVCTAWSINEAKSLFVTAAHCYINDRAMYVDGQLAWLAFLDEYRDVAVVQVLGTKRPALKPSTKTLVAGMPIAAYGHAFGYYAPVFRPGVIGHPLITIDIPNLPQFNGRSWLMASFPYIGGMSGGPVVDEQGRVVSLVQLGNATIGLGIPVAELRVLIGQFWR